MENFHVWLLDPLDDTKQFLSLDSCKPLFEQQLSESNCFKKFTAECLTRIKFYELDDALESSAGGKDVLSF